MRKWEVWLDTGVDYVAIVVSAYTRKQAALTVCHMSYYGTWPIMSIQEAI